MLPLSYLLRLGGVVIWLVAAAGFYHVVSRHMALPAEAALGVGLIAYGAALIALAGWMVQSWISMRNSRKQHTINVLFQTRMSQEFTKHVATLEAKFPLRSSIGYAAAREEKAVLEAVRFILNYYEFIAVGIRHRDLDEPLMRDCICTQLCLFCDRANDVIRNVRGEDSMGKPDPTKKRIFRNLRWLYWRWEPVASNRPFPWLVRICRWCHGYGRAG